MEKTNFRADAKEIETNITARIPPYNIDAEKSVLCSIMLSRPAAESACDILHPDDFYEPAHVDIFTAMTKIYNRGTPIDAITVIDALEQIGKLKSAGGTLYITELSVYTPSAANVNYYVQILKEQGTRRRLIEAGGVIVSDSFDTQKPVTDTLNEAERKIYQIATNKTEDSLVHIAPAVFASYKRIGELMSLKGKISGMPSGFPLLDGFTSGFQQGDLVILAARPSVGKTSFALNMAAHAALRSNKTVAIFSLEMSSEQLVMRLLCSEAMVDMQKIKNATATDEELGQASDMVGPLERSNIYIDDMGSSTVPEIRTKCRRLKAKSGLDMVIIDYLQLMKGADKTKDSNRVQEISSITRELKLLARELKIPFIVLSQLSREPAKRKESPQPVMSDLRDSGSIEQDADTILMLYRPKMHEKSDTDECELIISKNRNGPVGKVKLMWNPTITRFTECTEQSWQEDGN